MGEKYKEASFTVEAVFVMVIVVWMMVSLIYAALYTHDRIVMKSDLQLFLMKEDISEETFMKSLEGKLFFIQCESVEKSKGLFLEEATLEYQVNVKDKGVLRMLFQSKKTGSIHVERANVNAVEKMWQATVLEG